MGLGPLAMVWLGLVWAGLDVHGPGLDWAEDSQAHSELCFKDPADNKTGFSGLYAGT